MLLLTHEYPPTGGGVSNIVFNHAIKYVQKGVDVTILTCEYKNYPIRLSKNIDIQCVWGSRSSELNNNIIPTFLSFILLGFQKGNRIIKTKTPDIIHSCMTVPAGIVGTFLSKKQNREPYVAPKPA